jgi:hypothetical protein
MESKRSGPLPREVRSEYRELVDERDKAVSGVEKGKKPNEENFVNDGDDEDAILETAWLKMTDGK